MASSSKSIETVVWKAVSENPGFTATKLGDKLGDNVSKKDLVAALNGLLSKDLVKISKTNKGDLIWNAVDIVDAKTKNAMSGDERLVFSAIEAAGNKGIWSRTITSQTNLPNAVVTKVLSKLVSAKQIKTVKDVEHLTRKIYMLADIDPSSELSGGPWYTDFELDPEFIRFVKGACLKYVQKKSFPNPDDHSDTAQLYPATSVDRYPSVLDITRFIKSAKITETNLAPEHIEEIMNVLVYEGSVERLPGNGDVRRMRDDDDSDDEDVLIKKTKKRKASRKAESDGSEEEDARRKRKRKSSKARDSDSESDNDRSRSRSRSRSRRSKRREESDDSESEDDRKSSSSKRGRKRRNVSDASSSDSEDGTSRSKKKSKKSRRKDSNSDDTSLSSGSEEDAKPKSKRKSTNKSSKKVVVEDEDVDLNTAFGHLLSGSSVYRAIRQERVGLGWSQAPCGRCPQLEFCEDSGPVNPVGCKYYSDWLVQAIGEL